MFGGGGRNLCDQSRLLRASPPFCDANRAGVPIPEGGALAEEGNGALVRPCDSQLAHGCLRAPLGVKLLTLSGEDLGWTPDWLLGLPGTWRGLDFTFCAILRGRIVAEQLKHGLWHPTVWV